MRNSKETVVQMAKANGVRWYGHVLRRDDRHVLRKGLEFEVKGKRMRGRPKKTWKTQVEKESIGQYLAHFDWGGGSIVKLETKRFLGGAGWGKGLSLG